jgi:hypothetical protein
MSIGVLSSDDQSVKASSTAHSSAEGTTPTLKLSALSIGIIVPFGIRFFQYLMGKPDL